MTESLEIAHSGMNGAADAARPRTAADRLRQGHARRSTAAPTLECYFNPTEYSISKTNDVELREGHRHVAHRTPEFGGGQPRQMELSLLFDQTLPAVHDDRARRHRRAARRDGGAGRRRAAARRPRSPPFVTFQWGTLIVQGRLHVADRARTSSSARRRADPRRRQADAQAGRAATDQGPEPDDARAAPASACTPSATATRCRRSPTAPTATRRAGG